MSLGQGRVRQAAGTAAIAVVLGWAAWHHGLFFETDVYALELVLFGAGALLGLLGLLGSFIDGRLRSLGVSTVVLLPLGVAACYGIGFLAGPVSIKGTVDAMLRWTAYACWLALLWVWWKKPAHRAWGEAAFQAVGIFLLAGGWLGWFDVLRVTDIVIYFDDPELSATGARLAGFLQYPNAYGAAIAFFLVRQWQAWSGSGKWAALCASLTSVPYAGALLLTESRGSWLALLLGLALAWWFARDRHERSRLLLGAGITAAGAALAAYGAWRISSQGGWLTAIASVAGALAMYGLWIWLSRKPQEKLHFVAWLAAAVLAAGGLALVWAVAAGTGGGRISGQYGTAASRLLFYQDGWRMFKDSIWIGHGGKGWRTLFGLYQSHPYVGGEVHSGYLDMLVETGLSGLTVAAAMICILLWKVWKRDRKALAPAAVLLVHSAVDFDLSYGWMWLHLLAWLALFGAGEDGGSAGGVRPAGRWGAAGRRVAAALLLGAAVWSAAPAWHGLAAVRASAAADTAATPAAREAELRAALEANPAWSRIRVALAPLLPEARERESVLAAGLRYEPQSGPLMLQLGLAEAELGRVAQAEVRLREAVRLDRFSRETQTAAIAAMSRMAETLDFAGRPYDARQAADAAASFFERYRLLVRQVEAMDRPANGKRFGMTYSALFHAAQAFRRLGQDEHARPLLNVLIEHGDDNWREQAGQLLQKIGSQTR